MSEGAPLGVFCTRHHFAERDPVTAGGQSGGIFPKRRSHFFAKLPVIEVHTTSMLVRTDPFISVVCPRISHMIVSKSDWSKMV